jgi:hypothetical protein
LGVGIFLLDEALFLVIVFAIAINNKEVSSQTKLMIEFSAVVFFKYKGPKIAFSGLNKAFCNAYILENKEIKIALILADYL